MPAVAMHAPAEMCEVFQEFCGMLQLEGCFAGLSWADAKAVAAAVSFDACTRDDAADFMPESGAKRTRAVSTTWRGATAEGAARALNIAATVLGL